MSAQTIGKKSSLKSTATSKPRTKVKQPTTRVRRWSNAQILAVILVAIPVLGGCTTAVFANWDKLTKAPVLAPVVTAVAGDPVVNNRIAVIDQSQNRLTTQIDETEKSVTNGVNASWTSKKISKKRKLANAEAGEKLKAEIALQKLKIQETYRLWHEAVNANDQLKADLIKSDLANQVLVLQRLVDRWVHTTGLKEFVLPPDYVIHQGPVLDPMLQPKKDKEPA
jgi:hypothetical protein